MKAEEARRMAKSVEYGENGMQYRDIVDKIKREVKLGHFRLMLYETILPGVKTKLEADGYTVMVYDDQREGMTVTIKW